MEKQIEEMAKVIEETERKKMDSHCDLPSVEEYATDLYTAGYRKQSEGEWVIVEYEYVTCSKCGHYHWSGCDSTAEAKERLAKGDVPNFCPNCGASMKGGAE